MNWTKFLIAFVVAFIFIFGFEFVWHGMLMKSSYMQVPALWRSEAEFARHFPFLLLGHAVIAFGLALIITRSGGGASAGAGLGFLVAIVAVGGDLITFAVQPITRAILGLWVVGGIVELIIAGAIIGAIYRRSSASG